MGDFKLATPHTVSGVQRSRQQGSGSVPLVDQIAASGQNGFLWTPQHLTVYMKNAAKFLDDRLSMQLMTQFNLHDLDPSTSDNIFLQNYHLGNLKVADLIAGTAPVWSNQYNYRSNSRLRS